MKIKEEYEKSVKELEKIDKQRKDVPALRLPKVGHYETQAEQLAYLDGIRVGNSHSLWWLNNVIETGGLESIDEIVRLPVYRKLRSLVHKMDKLVRQLHLRQQLRYRLKERFGWTLSLTDDKAWWTLSKTKKEKGRVWLKDNFHKITGPGEELQKANLIKEVFKKPKKSEERRGDIYTKSKQRMSF